MCGSSITAVAGSNGTTIKLSIIWAPKHLVREGGSETDRCSLEGVTRRIVVTILELLFLYAFGFDRIMRHNLCDCN
jgi:hypothetical protein